ncbi:MAG: PspC domain-containing protein [Bacteroidales bacterium]
MKKTVQIHIGGRHFQIDEDAYSKLNHYLEALKAHFKAEGETGREIVEDIELRIAELLENKLGNSKQSVTLDDVTETIGILGKVEDFSYADESADSKEDYHHDRKDYRRFYRDPDNRYLGGVSSGLGEYFDVDPLWIRLAFICLIFAKGVGILIYAILWIVVPKARTTTEKLQMRGRPVNLSTIKDTVNAEYEKVRSNVQGFSNSTSADRTRNALENAMRAIGVVIIAVFKFVIGAVGIFFLVIGSVFLAGLIMAILGFTNFFGHFQFWDGWNIPDYAAAFSVSGQYYLVIISLIVLVLIPVAALIYGGIKIIFGIRSNHRVLRAFLLTAWILALILFVTLVMLNVPKNAVKATSSQSTVIETAGINTVFLNTKDNTEHRKITHYRVMGLQFHYSDWDDMLYNRSELTLERSSDDKMHLTVSRNIRNIGMKHSERYFDRIDYNWSLNDSSVMLDEFFSTDDDDFWMFPDVELKLRIPEGQRVVITPEVCDMLAEDQRERYCTGDSMLTGKPCLISSDGLLRPENQNSSSKRN